jgi:hypothetical protein
VPFPKALRRWEWGAVQASPPFPRLGNASQDLTKIDTSERNLLFAGGVMGGAGERGGLAKFDNSAKGLPLSGQIAPSRSIGCEFTWWATAACKAPHRCPENLRGLMRLNASMTQGDRQILTLRSHCGSTS